MPRSMTLSRHCSSRYGSSACMLGTLACTSQSIADEVAVIVLMSLGQFQRAGEGSFGLGGELRVMVADEVGEHDNGDHRNNAENDPSAPAGQEPPGFRQVRELA